MPARQDRSAHGALSTPCATAAQHRPAWLVYGRPSTQVKQSSANLWRTRLSAAPATPVLQPHARPAATARPSAHGARQLMSILRRRVAQVAVFSAGSAPARHRSAAAAPAPSRLPAHVWGPRQTLLVQGPTSTDHRAPLGCPVLSGSGSAACGLSGWGAHSMWQQLSASMREGTDPGPRKHKTVPAT